MAVSVHDATPVTSGNSYTTSVDATDCPAGNVDFNVTSAVKDAAKYGWQATSFGLRAYDEGDELGWKRFDGDAVLRVYYNTVPPKPTPSQLSSTPGKSCTYMQWGSPARINQVPKLIAANLTDPDDGGAQGEDLTAEFEVFWTDGTGVERKWRPADSGTKVTKTSASGSKKSTFSVTVPQGVIPQNTVVGWAVRASDGEDWSPWSWAGSDTGCYFIYDPNAPAPPVITSVAADGYTEFNPADELALPQNGVGRYGKFNVTFDAEVTKYAFAVNTDPSEASARTKTATTEPVWVMPTDSGVNTLYVTVWDAAGNSMTGNYRFWVSEGTPAEAYWKLNEQTGAPQLADSADHAGGEASYPADVHGGMTFERPGMVGTAVDLDGTSGYATTSGKVLDTTKSFSVSAWAKLPATKPTSAAIIATQAGVKKSGFELYYSASYDKWIFNRYQADTDTAQPVRALGTAAVGTGTGATSWVHLVGVYDQIADQVRLYINGNLAGSAAYPDADAWNATGKVQIGVGSYGAGPQLFFPGDIDDVKLYDRVVSRDEAQQMFAVKSQVVGLWHLNTGSGSPVTSPDAGPATPKSPMSLAGGAAITTDEAKTIVTPPDGQTAGALDLPGGNGDYASVAAPVVDTGESFTVSAWVQTLGTPVRSMSVLSLPGAYNSAVSVRYDAAKQRYVLDVPSKDGSGATITTVEHSNFHQGPYGEWDHLAVVYDGFASTITLYVNGNKEAGAEAPTVSFRENIRTFTPTTSVQLGRTRTNNAYPSGQNWGGQIDDVWVLHGAATEEEIAYLSNRTQIEFL